MRWRPPSTGGRAPGRRSSSRESCAAPDRRAGEQGGHMNTAVRRKLDMAARVREFVRAHAATEPGYTPVVTRLDELLGQAEAILARQHQGIVAARGATAQRGDLRRTIHSQLVHYLVAV